MIKKEDHINSYSNSDQRIIDLLISDKIKLSVPLKSSNNVIWGNLKQQITNADGKQGKTQKETLFHFKHYIAVAATIIFLIGIFIFYKTNQKTYITEAGQILTVNLPDNSSVILNAKSKLTYHSFGWSNSREVFLSGEALFKVEKGSWFKVNSNIGNVSVLGTCFNVFVRDKNFKVDCFTGKVKVKLNNNDNSVILTQGLSTEKNNSNSLNDPAPFNMNETGKWQQGQFYYSNEPLENVFAEIERQFNVKIIADNLIDRYYSGSFNNDNLNEALKLVCLPMGLKYELKNESTIYVTINK